MYERRVLTGVTGFLRVVPDAVRYRVDRAGYAGGTFSGVVRGGLTGDPPSFEVDLSLDGLSLRALAADQEHSVAREHAWVAAEARLQEIRVYVERLEALPDRTRQDAGDDH